MHVFCHSSSLQCVAVKSIYFFCSGGPLWEILGNRVNSSFSRYCTCLLLIIISPSNRRASIIWGSSPGGIINLSPVVKSFGFTACSKYFLSRVLERVFLRVHFCIFAILFFEVLVSLCLMVELSVWLVSIGLILFFFRSSSVLVHIDHRRFSWLYHVWTIVYFSVGGCNCNCPFSVVCQWNFGMKLSPFLFFSFVFTLVSKTF